METKEQQSAANSEGDGMDLDDLLPQVGEYGRYQKLLLWLVCLPACLPCGFAAFNQLFMTGVPPHWCRVPELEGIPSTVRRHLAIPLEASSDINNPISSLNALLQEDSLLRDFMADVLKEYKNHRIKKGGRLLTEKYLILEGSNSSYSQCSAYAVNWTALLEESPWEELEPDSSWTTQPCAHGWEYNTTEITSSIVIDFDLVCAHSIYPTLGLVALNTGGPAGVYAFGWLSDRIGRRLSFFTCLTTLLVGSLLTPLAQDFWSWAAYRAIVGLTIPAIYQIPFIIGPESKLKNRSAGYDTYCIVTVLSIYQMLVGANYRSFVTVMMCIFYTMGLIVLSGVAYLVRDWVTLSIVTSVPFLVYYFYWCFLPESPRWLLARGRFEEASKILETLAKINNKELPPTFRQKLKQKMALHRTKSEEIRLKQTPGMMMLCKTPNMRLKTILITLNWFANEMVYVGLCYYGPALGSNEYISFLLSSLVEIPSYLACWVVMDRWGRRWPLCVCMLVGGVSCIVTVLLPEDAVNTTLALFLFSKFAISASFLIIYPFSGELYPTQLRGVGIGTSAYISGLGLILIPFVTYLGSEMLAMPLVIMGVISVVGGIAGLRLPETLHQRLPQTLEEGEEFGKDWTMKDCLNCIPQRPSSAIASYEDLSNEKDALELSSEPQFQEDREMTPFAKDTRRASFRTPRLVRQSSIMETPIDASGVMKLTYWF